MSDIYLSLNDQVELGWITPEHQLWLRNHPGFTQLLQSTPPPSAWARMKAAKSAQVLVCRSGEDTLSEVSPKDLREYFQGGEHAERMAQIGEPSTEAE
ncbi:hypothetical protein [cf. Phormidesmis sp. LEGE 11477]|uniref:hypothetical protein n=1 Tax=cf. Phormidesmis sp. LEGE 11477 TaxID=1828680 RepID=UPI0018816EBA|nr:hypothetical protein [cf. Phormidesmis sp. LEGE 11477]MBE9061858.1 hypothetical protein [cf. Phormidesmis sp. LEGE 11477]